MSFQSLHSVDEDHRSSAVMLDKSRTAALERVDKAPFSYVFPKIIRYHKVSRLGS